MLLNFYCHYYVGLLKRELEKHILSFTLEICLIIQSVGLNHVQFQGRLRTQEKFAAHEITHEVRCDLCNAEDNLDHLYIFLLIMI